MIRTNFNPFDWYWNAEDGRVFSSAKAAAIAPTDLDYLNWVAAGNRPTPWPRDLSGGQTLAALQDVLTPYDIFADLTAYAANVRWKKEVGGMTLNGVDYPTDRETQSKMGSAFLLAMADPTSTFKWKLSDGTFTPTIDATTMQAVAKAVGQYVNGCFLTEETVAAAVAAGTITTRAQVDAAFG